MPDGLYHHDIIINDIETIKNKSKFNITIVRNKCFLSKHIVSNGI